MLTMALPDVEMLVVSFFILCFNAFAKWHQLHRQMDRQTDRQTDSSIMPIADPTACSNTIGTIG